MHMGALRLKSNYAGLQKICARKVANIYNIFRLFFLDLRHIWDGQNDLLAHPGKVCGNLPPYWPGCKRHETIARLAQART
jgi:hypothetical protein